jgi:hypothetical protein
MPFLGNNWIKFIKNAGLFRELGEFPKKSNVSLLSVKIFDAISPCFDLNVRIERLNFGVLKIN